MVYHNELENNLNLVRNTKIPLIFLLPQRPSFKIVCASKYSIRAMEQIKPLINFFIDLLLIFCMENFYF